jgi:hypothetical protein
MVGAIANSACDGHRRCSQQPVQQRNFAGCMVSK